MSILIIKQELETRLNTAITTVAIKWANTSVVTLNSVTLTQTQIDALTVYIEPKMIPIESPRELISTANGVNYKTFFQVDIWIKKNQGTGNSYVINAALDTLFRDKNFNGVVCEQVDTLGSFEVEEFVVFPLRVLAHVWG